MTLGAVCHQTKKSGKTSLVSYWMKVFFIGTRVVWCGLVSGSGVGARPFANHVAAASMILFSREGSPSVVRVASLHGAHSSFPGCLNVDTSVIGFMPMRKRTIPTCRAPSTTTLPCHQGPCGLKILLACSPLGNDCVNLSDLLPAFVSLIVYSNPRNTHVPRSWDSGSARR